MSAGGASGAARAGSQARGRRQGRPGPRRHPRRAAGGQGRARGSTVGARGPTARAACSSLPGTGAGSAHAALPAPGLPDKVPGEPFRPLAPRRGERAAGPKTAGSGGRWRGARPGRVTGPSPVAGRAGGGAAPPPARARHAASAAAASPSSAVPTEVGGHALQDVGGPRPLGPAAPAPRPGPRGPAAPREPARRAGRGARHVGRAGRRRGESRRPQRRAVVPVPDRGPDRLQRRRNLAQPREAIAPELGEQHVVGAPLLAATRPSIPIT